METHRDNEMDTPRLRVVVAGGGIAGLETVLALSRLAADRIDMAVISPEREFTYRPLLVAEPFGAAEALRIDLGEVLGEAGARHVHDALARVDPTRRVVDTAGGAVFTYDALVIAIGASPVEAVPGALAFSGAEERRQLTPILRRLGRRGTKRLVFIVPAGVSWSIAAYELALLTAAERDARRLPEVELVVVTHESDPLGVFGPEPAQLVAERLAAAGITVKTGSVAVRVEEGHLVLESGERIEAGGFVALPKLQVAPMEGIPQRPGGFVQTDAQMHVVGLQSVWAAGDATWFPVKQGGLAAQQADVAARSIAVAAGVRVPTEPFHPVLRAALITGDNPEFLRVDLATRGSGEGAGRALWSPPAKVAGKYLGPYIAGKHGAEPEQEQLVDLSGSADAAHDAAEYERALSLLLAAADADAAAGDYESALKWLRFVEQLDFVVPSSYVARRYEWRRELEPSLAPDEAAIRIDPTFESGEAALHDLELRLGWMRELGGRRETEMRADLSEFDAGMEQLRALTKRAGIFKPH